MTLLIVVFFFSSRRRHTRFDCDWSSDVCSSDLASMIRGNLRSAESALGSEMVMTTLPKAESRAIRSSTLRYRSGDRKSTRLNSSHSQISYAVFCLKKKRTSAQPAIKYQSRILEL